MRAIVDSYPRKPERLRRNASAKRVIKAAKQIPDWDTRILPSFLLLEIQISFTGPSVLSLYHHFREMLTQFPMCGIYVFHYLCFQLRSI